MNKDLAAFLIALFVFGSTAAFILLIPRSPEPAVSTFKHEVEIIDGCEYLRFFSANNYEAITHKGSCKNH